MRGGGAGASSQRRPSRRPVQAAARAWKLGVTIVAIVGVGCTSSSDLARLETKLDAVELQVLQVQKDGATRDDVAGARQAVVDELASLRGQQAELQRAVQQVGSRVEALESKLDDTGFRLAQLNQQLAAATQELQTLRDLAEAVRSNRRSSPRPSGRTVSADPSAPEDPRVLYDDAYDDYVAGNLDLAVLGFRQLLERFPDGELADNATYWLGESYYRQGRFEDAIAQFDQVLTRFTGSDRSASSVLKKGYAYLELGQRAQGVVQLQRVICDFGGTDEALLATNRLAELGLSPDC
ncbi:MAG: outer membrane protein assembly factor BamD [Acidobacteriota bacterium]